jgi:putative nucleotidyltransferase with HDIG domain
VRNQQLSIVNTVNMEAIEEFCHQIYYRDPYTLMHAEHVAELMAGLAAEMGMNSDEISLAFIVGLIHDVGKIKTPADILTKPGKLTEEEFEIMQKHAYQGAEIIAGIEGAQAVLPSMLHHHERYDGKGYPDGLAGENIPLLSRMLAICDSFDAMTTNRCYRGPVDLGLCIEEVKLCAGAQFDPEICRTFVAFLESRFGFGVE